MKKNNYWNGSVLLKAGVVVSVVVLLVVVFSGFVAGDPPVGVRRLSCNRVFDVNRDGRINFQDAGLCHVYSVSPESHTFYGDLLYDVNMDGVVDDVDVDLIWSNRD